MSQQGIQLDGNKEVTLKLKTSSVAFITNVLGAQSMASVAQAGQDGLLTQIANQLIAQHQPTETKPATGSEPDSK